MNSNTVAEWTAAIFTLFNQSSNRHIVYAYAANYMHHTTQLISIDAQSQVGWRTVEIDTGNCTFGTSELIKTDRAENAALAMNQGCVVTAGDMSGGQSLGFPYGPVMEIDAANVAVDVGSPFTAIVPSLPIDQRPAVRCASTMLIIDRTSSIRLFSSTDPIKCIQLEVSDFDQPGGFPGVNCTLRDQQTVGGATVYDCQYHQEQWKIESTAQESTTEIKITSNPIPNGIALLKVIPQSAEMPILAYKEQGCHQNSEIQAHSFSIDDTLPGQPLLTPPFPPPFPPPSPLPPPPPSLPPLSVSSFSL